MKKSLYIIIAAVIMIIAIAGILRFVVGGDEDTWLCDDGQWVKHGHPSASKPATGCTNAKAAIDADAPVLTYEAFANHDPLYTFDVVKEWTSIAPAEVQKSVTMEQLHGYGIVYYSSSADSVALSVSEKSSASLTTMSAIIADDKSVAKANPNVTMTDERINQTDARTEMTVTSGSAAYTVYSRYLIVSAVGNNARWALMEVTVPTNRIAQYANVVARLLDSLQIAGATANTNQASVDPGQLQWSTMDQGPYRDKVTYATSPDLLNWTASGKILAEHASVPGAVVKDGTIFAYFVDVSTDGIKEQLGMVTSADQGKTWTARQILDISGLGNRAVADPDPVLLSDGRIRLYYFDINEIRLSKPENGNEPTNKIYSAISNDGLNFVQEEGIRFQRQGIFDPDVNLFGRTWYLYGGDVEGNKVVVSTSADGLTFSNGAIAYSGGAVPDVFQKNNTYYLFTAGIDIATSADPMSFSGTGKSFHDPNNQITADPSVVQLADGSYLMLYKVKSN
jgi:hypothetical protein